MGEDEETGLCGVCRCGAPAGPAHPPRSKEGNPSGVPGSAPATTFAGVACLSRPSPSIPLYHAAFFLYSISVLSDEETNRLLFGNSVGEASALSAEGILDERGFFCGRKV